jgi:small subunit ribosomal protein S20
MAEKMMTALPKSEDEVKGLETLISEAHSEIDRAVVKGTLHKNTGARKKARCSRYEGRLSS